MNSTKDAMMMETLTIRIIDDDNFYIAGLIMALSNHLKNKKIIFYTGPSNGITADITFQAIRCGTLVSPTSASRGRSPRHYFAIADRKDAHLQHLYRGVITSNILYRHQSVSTVLHLIEDNLFTQQPPLEDTQHIAEVCLHEPLTRREQEVLRHLKQGKTHASVASCMGIKEKTISSHKRAAMKKLNFKRTSELFHWMLQGGLTSH
ncbi:TPA: response regulator transcription factor [Serratia fonticola]|jgi:DNA-binding CsgD family transcriptional regulator|uniref:helix-turn-helix transcriptional regulator n=1 Tax=Serratia fonticola TaxID=47917 RepID=UPI00217AF52F|nr:LuxR C-terminal-related transcriptional regulator [Serratia fonticola]CAI1243470.1 two component system sensor kinase SsrB [Serratia fonticola]